MISKRNYIVLSLMLSVSILFAQNVEIEGDGTSERQFLVKNEGNVNSHAFLTVHTASDQFGTSPNLEAKRSRGTLLNPENVEHGDRLLNLVGGLYQGGIYRYNASIELWVGNSPSDVSFPTYITFSTTGNNEMTRSEKLRITEEGNIGIGTTSPASKLEVSDGDVFIEDINHGVIMKSPNGACWRIQPDNTGNLVTTTVTCPN